MNGYNYEYLDFLNGVPINDSGFMINGNNNYFMPSKGTDIITSNPYEGFIRGNMFDDLYEPYKDYKIRNIEPNNEKEALMLQLMQYKFALIDLGLYLDVNPNDSKALNLYSNFLSIKKEIENKYENSYGPLDLSGKNISNGSWKWTIDKFPWEVIK